MATFGLHNSSSIFPASIDAREFFSDLKLRHTDIRDGFNALIKNQQYQQASQYLYDNIEAANLDMDYNGAYLWNRIENKLVVIEQEYLNMPDNLVRSTYGSTAPTTNRVNRKTVWIA